MNEHAKEGRPTSYSKERAEAVCERIVQGDSLRQIEKLPGMPSKRTILNWLAKHEEFRKLYAAAHEIQSESDMDDLVCLADQTANTHQEKVRLRRKINVLKWRIEKRLPQKYSLSSLDRKPRK